MYLEDNKDKCIFYDRSFQDDLYPFTFEDTFSNFSLKFARDIGGPVKVKVNFKDNPRTLIPQIKILEKQANIPENQWVPILINDEISAKYIDNQTLFRGTMDPSDSLGIENVFSFSADSDIFRSWDITNGDMTIDWLLTSPLVPFKPKYGLLCWYYHNPDKSIGRTGTDPVSAENVPYNTVVQMLGDYSYPGTDASNGTKWIKKDKNTFYIYDKTTIGLSNDENIIPLEISKIFSISKYLSENPAKKIEDIKFSIVGGEFDLEPGHREIYIPQGEAYSYFNSDDEMIDIYKIGGFSRTYLSPTLFPIYREIFHGITSNFKRDKNLLNDSPLQLFSYSDELGSSIGTDYSYRIFRKICYFLSTHPLVDRTTLNILLDTDIIYYISKFDYRSKSIESEISILYDILLYISKKLSILIGSTKISTNSNYIASSTSDLFSILSQKYGLKLKLKDTAKLKYKQRLAHGPHLKINQDIISKCSKLLRNTSVYNNIQIDTPPYMAKSDIGNDHSSFKLMTKQNDGKISTIDIPLWDVEKTKIKDLRLPITAGPDIEIDFNDEKYLSKEATDENNKIKWREVYTQLDKASIPRSDPTNPNILGGEDPKVEWSLFSGSDCLRFSNDSLNNIPGANRESRYKTSQDYNPIVYIKRPGKYIVQLKVITSFGIIYDNINIYVNDKIGNIPPKQIYDRSSEDPIELLSPEKIQYIESKNNLAVMLPNIRECAIGKQGVFWPSYSDCSVRYPKPKGFPFIQSFGDPLHKFSFPTYKNKPKNFDDQSSSLEIIYSCNNTNIYLNRIILSNMMDKNDDCYQCQSFYRGIVDNYGFYLDAGVSSDKQFLDNDNELVTIPGPSNLSTKKTIIKPYGGFSREVVNQLGVNIPGHPEPGSNLKDISSTGNPPNNNSKSKINYICHHSLLDYKSELEFNKGFFHPKYGWLDTSIDENKIFVNNTICHNFIFPEYNSYNFKGMGFSDLSNENLDRMAVYKSSIEINKDPLAQSVVIPEGASDEERKSIIESHEKLEVDDHDKIYGYRSSAGEFGKSIRDSDILKTNSIIQPDTPDNADSYCDYLETNDRENLTTIYSITQPGPYSTKKEGDITYRYDRSKSLDRISNIKVKLNFLNYINPKELIIWLEVKACGKVAYELNPPPKEGGGKPRAKDPWSYSYNSINLFDGIESINDDKMKISATIVNYIKNLYRTNINYGSFKDGFSDTYIIPLLNHDHVANYTSNHSLIFSDTDNRSLIYSNPLTNINNIFEKTCDINNQTIFLSPTMSANDFNDHANEFLRNILKINYIYYGGLSSLNILNNIPLFDTAPSDSAKSPPSDSGSTKFTLCIAVAPDTDTNISSVYDSLLLTNSLCDITSSTNKNRSSILKNSLCSWEVILDNHSKFKSNIFDSLSYTNIYDNKYDTFTYYGFNYIYDFTDRLHLLPPAVLNAPYKSIIDNQLCKYSREILNVPRYEKPLPLNILPLIFLMPSNGTEGIAAAESADESIKEITKGVADWFNNQRKASQQEVYDRALNTPSYSNHPIGESNKALLSVSTDGKVWYKLEASIYKYRNTTAISSPKYRYYKLHATSLLDNFSIFSYTKPKTITDLIDKSNIKHIYIDINDYSNYVSGATALTMWNRKNSSDIEDLKKQIDILKNDKDPDTELINNIEKTISNIGLGIFEGDLVELHNQPEESDNGLYQYTVDDEYIKINSFGDLCSNLIFSKNNISNFIDNNIDSIDNLIIIQGLRPYYFFRYLFGSDIVTMSAKILSTDDKNKIDDHNNEITEIENKGDVYIYENQEELKKLKQNIFDLRYNQYTNRINGIGYITKNGIYYTIINLRDTIEGNQISVLEQNSANIVIFNNDISTIKNNNSNNFDPINIWEFINKEKTNVNFDSPTMSYSTHAEGNYGWGSNVARNQYFTDPRLDKNETWYDGTILNTNIESKSAKSILANFYYKDKQTNKINDEISLRETLFNYGYYGYTLDDIEQVLSITTNKKLLISDSESQKDLLNYLKKENNYNTYIEKTKNYAFIDMALSRDSFTKIKSDTGLIGFHDDIQPTILYGFDKDITENTFTDRLKQLEDLITQQAKTAKKADKKYDEDDPSKSSSKDIAVEQLKQLIYEQTQIEYYLEKFKTIKEYKYKTDIPNISIKVKINKDESLSFEEKENNNYYWINIDPEQACSIDYDKSPKVLYKVRYECVQQNNVTPMDVDQICPKSSGLFGNAADDESISVQGNIVEYTLSKSTIKKNMKKCQEKYGDVGFFPESEYTDADINYTTSRDFFLNGFGEGRNTLIKATYYYILPTLIKTRANYKRYTDTIEKDGVAVGNVKNKVKYLMSFWSDAFGEKEISTDGIEKINKLLVDFKRIPRKIKGIDNQYDVYEPNPLGQLSKSIIPSPGGPIDGSFKIWRCLDSKTGKYVNPPTYFQWLNEMLFRGHFGSVDGAENAGRNSIESKDETAWIPYDYE